LQVCGFELYVTGGGKMTGKFFHAFIEKWSMERTEVNFVCIYCAVDNEGRICLNQERHVKELSQFLLFFIRLNWNHPTTHNSINIQNISTEEPQNLSISQNTVISLHFV
jgi:hypothetical protein